MVNQRELTEEGLEKNFATNTLGKIIFKSNSCAVPLFWKMLKKMFLVGFFFFNKSCLLF